MSNEALEEEMTDEELEELLTNIQSLTKEDLEASKKRPPVLAWETEGDRNIVKWTEIHEAAMAGRKNYKLHEVVFLVNTLDIVINLLEEAMTKIQELDTELRNQTKESTE